MQDKEGGSVLEINSKVSVPVNLQKVLREVRDISVLQERKAVYVHRCPNNL